MGFRSVVDTETDEDVDVKIVSNEEGIIEIDTESEPNDIEITYTIEEHVRGFKPIGEYDTAFTGSFDGQGYEVDTLYIDRVEENIGLFGYTEGSIVKNTGLVNNDITGANSRVGGLVGANFGDVRESYATGSVTGYGKEVGGLVGNNFPDGEVSDSYATGEVTGDEDVGGLVGDNFDGTVSESYWDTESSGMDESDGGTGLTTSEMQGSSAESNMDFDFEIVWEVVDSDYPTLVNLP